MQMSAPLKSLAIYLASLACTAVIAAAQDAPAKDLVPALKQTCQTIKLILEHGVRGNPCRYDSAAKLCAYLESQSDPVALASPVHDLYQLFAHMNLAPATAPDRLAALESDAPAGDGPERFYALKDLAKVALEAGDLDKATIYSQELLKCAPQYPKDWNYGNAIYYGNFVLGRIALQRGDIQESAARLLAAGATRGSPQLNTFGPNMTLARDLLAKGQTEQVLSFLAACKGFWKMDRGQLDQWMAAIRAGETPDFSLNLAY
jgi:tetratricopeptide (TPR) repeat protein